MDQRERHELPLEMSGERIGDPLQNRGQAEIESRNPRDFVEYCDGLERRFDFGREG
jgi:hypothetical protein